MAAVDQGPASSNAEFFFGNTVGLEVHVPSSGLNPLSPQDQANPVDPQIGSGLTSQTQQNFFFGASASMRFRNPA